MKKFTIIDKPKAREILLSNPTLSQEDREKIFSNPVFSVLVAFFEKYYDLSLLSTYDAEMNYDHRGMYKNRLINQFIPDGYVSMDPTNDHLAEYYKTGIDPRFKPKATTKKLEIRVEEKIKGDSICKYTFCLDGYGYALELKREAKEFSKFTRISKIERGTMMGDCFDVVGKLDDIKEFHEVYDLDGRGIYFEEDSFCEKK
jgi:hypothetical protein